ncbi:hypothetical protein MMAN_02310 [Mycobacterium mantenii]|uniref:Uncharacterized protein n=1 Tax=Mycobacterium mantenii TaxID=560555 RepID=A0ABN6A3U8_MYCNT|nr:hypothetical protein MMAN_02310 [Mycobacterium mantenii]
MQALADRVVRRRDPVLVTQYDDDDAVVWTGYNNRDGEPVQGGHHRGHLSTLQPNGMRARGFWASGTQIRIFDRTVSNDHHRGYAANELRLQAI